MDLLSEISKDHQEFRDQLTKMAKTAKSNPDESVEIFRSVFEHLVAHHETEEHLVFPKLKAYEDAKDPVGEALEEHKAIDLYLEWVKASHKTERWEAKVSVLEELISSGGGRGQGVQSCAQPLERRTRFTGREIRGGRTKTAFEIARWRPVA